MLVLFLFILFSFTFLFICIIMIKITIKSNEIFIIFIIGTIIIFLYKANHKQNVLLDQEEDSSSLNLENEKYANIIFTPDIYNNRECIHQLLKENHIHYAGRFGEWDYLWTDQSMISGKKAAYEVAEEMK